MATFIGEMEMEMEMESLDENPNTKPSVEAVLRLIFEQKCASFHANPGRRVGQMLIGTS